ncbi:MULTISPECIES: ABC transporter permease [unclassified Fusibacter]|uniref:ABC transporter permease n=1 Tax=unclassified Fusibacter TaxID=2624464 RepID=UPI0013E94BFD|nr:MULTISPECIES: ABC transporter permease [unclassified Fusibacter]MCK8059516.1 ABC transporter permease [Fusibacter sp. A2]NPE21020.1 ABC transporter permease [Fusibacter sp. A1]
MKTNDLTGMGLRNLWRRKTRTILTVLGVVIGSSAILLMISLGLGQERAFQKSLEMFGNIRIIEVDNYGSWDSDGKTETPKLNADTVEMIKQIEGVQSVLSSYGTYVQLKAGKYEGGAQLMGVNLDDLEAFQFKLGEGELPKPTDKNALIVGASFAEMFYDPRSREWQPADFDPLITPIKGFVGGEYDQNGNKKRAMTFKVSGMLEPSGNNDYTVFMDQAALLKLIEDEERKNPNGNGGGKKKNEEREYERVQVLCETIDDVEVIHQTLKDMGLGAYSPIEYVKYEKQKMQTQQMVLGGIGAVSLLIAAIGITNTMIMAIYERTKEIGVMKVLGAEVKDIMKLFLFEAAIIGLLGGLVGIGISLIGSDVINAVNASMQADMMGNFDYYGELPEIQDISYIPMWLIGSSLLFSTFIGVVSGFLPAVRATKLSALEAIRNE